MRVIILGASGFIGSHTCSGLKDAGHEVIAVSRDPIKADRILQLGVETISYEHLHKHIDDYTSCTWIDFSWQGVMGSERNSEAQFDNVERVKEIANLAVLSKAISYIGVGSQAEYGPVDGAITEVTSLNPTSNYGRAKIQAFEALSKLLYDSGTRFVWVRIFSTYGPGDADEWLIPSLVRSLITNSQLKLTKCEQRWDYLFVRDAAEAFVSLVETEGVQGVFNLGSGIATPLKEIVNQIAKLINPTLQLEFGGQLYRSDQVMHLEADISALTAVTGWTPKTDLRVGITETVLSLVEGARENL